MRHFWNWVRNEDESRTLYLEGVIAEESWFADDITPAMCKEELFAGNGPIRIHLNSPGGDCIAASQIYTMLMDYPGDVTIQVDGMAASAASVIAMAGTHVTMSPTSLMMIHNPFTMATGDTDEMRKAIQLLDEVKESIINAYSAKTGLRHNKIAELMSNETWMNAKKAVELGFADEVLYDGKEPEPDAEPGEDAEPVTVTAQIYSGRLMDQAILNRLCVSDTAGEEPPASEPAAPTIGMDGKTAEGAVPYQILMNQLDFLK